MGVLIAGVVLWSIVHLLKSAAPDWHAERVASLGENRWKGIVTVLLVLSIVLIVIGWRSTRVDYVYSPPLYGSPVITALMFLSFLLFAGASAPGNIKRFLRHPMLLGTIVWSIAHLLANGENRSIVLFGGIGLWALLSIILINRRDGAWEKPPAVGIAKDGMTLAGTIVIFAIVIFVHPWVFGAPALPGL